MDREADLASVRRGFELFNAGDLDTLFREVFHPRIDYHGDPNISVLTGLPVEAVGADEVRDTWQEFFDMFDEVTLSEIELETDPDGHVLGSCRMHARGGASKVPIDAPFHFAWVLEEGLWRFLAAELDQAGARKALSDWSQGQSGSS